MRRRQFLLAPLLLAATARAQQPSLKPWPGVVTPPLELEDIDGKPHRLADYRGKAVLINFWATWCTPCREEIPSIERLRASLAGRPFAVLAVNVGENSRSARAFLDTVPNKFTVLLDRDGSFFATICGHPQIVKITADGKVAARLGTGSYPLGVKSHMEWEVVRDSLGPGERLLFHSDGLTEARNVNEHELGDSYVDAIIGWSPSASPAALVDTIVAEWNLFTGGRPPEDDVSVAVIARR